MCSTLTKRFSVQKLALLHHPDKNPGKPEATVEFQKVSRAYNDLNRHFERREASINRPDGASHSSFYSGTPFFSFNPSGHAPNCSCGADDFEDYGQYEGSYSDESDGDEMDFFRYHQTSVAIQPLLTRFYRFIFEEMMNSQFQGPPRFYAERSTVWILFVLIFLLIEL